MSIQTKKGVGRKATLTAYKSANKMQANRRKKLERQIKRQPNNKNLQIALKDIRYRRATPKVPFWSASMIAIAKLFKEFGGRVDVNIFSADQKKVAEALRTHSKYAQLPSPKKVTSNKPEASMFSIATRLANGRELVWSS